MLIPRKVSREGRDCRRNRAGPLQHAPDDDHVDIARHGCDRAAEHKQHQAEQNHRLATEPVRGRTKGDLQQRLRRAVGTNRQPHQGEVVATRDRARMHCEHGQDQEQPQHAQRKDGRKADPGSTLGGRHRIT